MEEIRAYYEQDREHDRLTRGLGLVEFPRTLEILGRVLPQPPAVVVDVGGGTGVYARELLRQGYAVHLLDAMPTHVRRVQADETLSALSSVTLGDARQLPYPDASADAALLLGPLYHLQDSADRAAALREAHRVLKPGGIIVTAMIPRAAMILGDFSNHLPDEKYCRPMREQTYLTGRQDNPELRRGYFTAAYFHQPEELEQELHTAGFRDVGLYAVEGPAAIIPDLNTVMNDPVKREGVLSACRLMERDRTLMGFSPHTLAVGRKPVRPDSAGLLLGEGP